MFEACMGIMMTLLIGTIAWTIVQSVNAPPLIFLTIGFVA